MAMDDWFRETYPWIPERDGNGHRLGAGLVTLSFDSCEVGCPARTDGRGHHIASCRVDGCRAPAARPADCTASADRS